MNIRRQAERIAGMVTTDDQIYVVEDAVTFFHHHEPNGMLAPTHPTSFVVDGT